MLRLWVLALLAVMPFGASATEFPELFSVTGVASDDVLNVRANHAASSNIVGHIAPDGKNIEIVRVSPDGKWGETNIGEASGWVSMRYLERMAGETENPLRTELSCFGTEPFWSLHLTQNQSAEFQNPDTGTVVFSIGTLTASSGQTGRYATRLDNAGFAVIRREFCSDGMSDRSYGLSVDVGLSSPELVMFSGCCSLTR